MLDNTDEIIEKCRNFLKKSSSKFSSQVTKQISDLESFNGNFWTDQIKKDIFENW